jgi:hypothetical protein
MHSRCPSLSGCCKTSSVVSVNPEQSPSQTVPFSMSKCGTSCLIWMRPARNFHLRVTFSLAKSWRNTFCRGGSLNFTAEWQQWSPVGGQCCRSPAYQIFREPHPDHPDYLSCAQWPLLPQSNLHLIAGGSSNRMDGDDLLEKQSLLPQIQAAAAAAADPPWRSCRHRR